MTSNTKTNIMIVTNVWLVVTSTSILITNILQYLAMK